MDIKKLLKTDQKIEVEAFCNLMLERAYYMDVKDLTNLKLQKLLYYAYAIYIWGVGKIMFDPNEIRCWRYGPVLKKAYNCFKHYGRDLIIEDWKSYERASIYEEVDHGGRIPDYKLYEVKSIYKGDVMAACRYAIIALGDKTAGDLIKLTHSKNSAWKEFFDSKEDKDKREINKNKNEDNRENEKKTFLSCVMKELESYGYFKDKFNENKQRYGIS